jgi:hypothetical protein
VKQNEWARRYASASDFVTFQLRSCETALGKPTFREWSSIANGGQCGRNAGAHFSTEVDLQETPLPAAAADPAFPLTADVSRDHHPLWGAPQGWPPWTASITS